MQSTECENLPIFIKYRRQGVDEDAIAAETTTETDGRAYFFDVPYSAKTIVDVRMLKHDKCWVNRLFEEITLSKPIVLNFVECGTMTVDSSQQTSASIFSGNGQERRVLLAPGRNKYCLQEPGTVRLVIDDHEQINYRFS